MSQELAKPLMCVQMRSGVELWVEKGKAGKLQDVLQGITQSKFIRYEDQTINSADIVGIFEAKTMEELTRRKNGQWLCKAGNWHERKGECVCLEEKFHQQIKKLYE